MTEFYIATWGKVDQAFLEMFDIFPRKVPCVKFNDWSMVKLYILDICAKHMLNSMLSLEVDEVIKAMELGDSLSTMSEEGYEHLLKEGGKEGGIAMMAQKFGESWVAVSKVIDDNFYEIVADHSDNHRNCDHDNEY